MSNKGSDILTISLLSLTMLSAMFLGASSTSATDNTDIVDEINITIPVSCTLTGTNLLHTDTIQNNQYKTDIGSATIKATCNDTNGLAIYAIGYTNETDGNNKMHSSTLDSSYDITTGKYVSGTTTNSVWSMKLTPVSGTYAPTIRNDASYNYTNYELIPSTYTKVAYRTTATDTGTGSTGANFTTDYAVYASATQPAGTYTGKVKFTIVHPQDAETPAQPIACEAGKICYNANANDVVGEMGKQTAENSASVTLYAPNFKRTGYGFAGWNTEYDYSGTTYGPNETITTPADTSTNGLSLYAVWVPSAGTLQNWSGCSGLAQGSVTALTDARDNDTYAVAKLADDKCWIIENLRLADKDSSNNDVILSNINTHNPSLPLTNSDGITTSNSLSASIDPTTTDWCYNYNSACIDKSMLATNNTTGFTSNTSTNYNIEGDVFSYGNYYNWYSATAGRGKYGSSYGAGYNATGDICPIGWHLPTGGLAGEYYNLSAALDPSMTSSTTDNNLYLYPNNFVYSGGAASTYVGSRGWDGAYWSSTAYSSGNAYDLEFDMMDDVYLENYSEKFYGSTVRCITGV